MKFKQGDTFDYSGDVSMTDAAGDAVDLTGWTVASKIHFPDAGETVSLTAEFTGGGYTNVRVYATDTSDWPLGPADMDIQFTSTSDVVVSTETLRIEIVEDVT